MTLRHLTRILALGAALAAAPLTAVADKDEAPPTPPRVALADARATALKQVPGTVLEEELEHSKKRGRWLYEFEIRPSAGDARVREVLIDADSGAVVAIELDDAD
jgi:uncharacterized membrane protein YkoI